MEFLSFDASNKSLTLKQGPIPKPKADEVLVRVAYSGICGTDLHIIGGTYPCKDSEPITLGHEFAGTIEVLGANVTNFKVGDKVTADPNSGCDLCDDCHGGCYNLCLKGGVNTTIGVFRDGGWATHVVVPEKQLYHVPEGVDMPQAALSEPLSCLAHGWDIMNPIHVGQKVLVLGAGIIGLLWASILHLHGLRRTVTIAEPQDKRREIVRNLGLEYEAKSPTELKGSEYNVVVDCSGSGPAMESAMPLLARGGRFCFFGVANPATKVTFEPYQMFKKELTFRAVNINPFSFVKALGLVQAMGKTYLEFDKLGIQVFKLSEYKKALEALKSGKISKAMFKL